MRKAKLDLHLRQRGKTCEAVRTGKNYVIMKKFLLGTLSGIIASAVVIFCMHQFIQKPQNEAYEASKKVSEIIYGAINNAISEEDQIYLSKDLEISLQKMIEYCEHTKDEKIENEIRNTINYLINRCEKVCTDEELKSQIIKHWKSQLDKINKK